MTDIPSKLDGLFDLTGAVALVTGGSGLLGHSHAKAFASAGANVVLADLDPLESEKRAEKLSDQYKVDCTAMKCDVTQPEHWQEIVSRITERFGKIDILVNNAGFTNRSNSDDFGRPFEEFPMTAWNSIMDVNLTGVFLGCQTVGKQMLKQESGSIINVASLYGLVSPNHSMYPGTGIRQPVAYSVSKAGVLAATRYIAGLWGDKGIRVNSITPGGMYDGQSELFVQRFSSLNPMRRMGLPDELAGAMIFLASNASSYCNGMNLVVDGGWTIW